MAAYLKKTASAEMRSTQYRQTGHRRRRRVLLLPVLLGLMLFLGGFLLGAAPGCGGTAGGTAGGAAGGGTSAFSGVHG